MTENKKGESEKINYPVVRYVQQDNLIKLNFDLSASQIFSLKKYLETS